MKILPNKAYFSKDSISYIQKNFKKILEGKSFLSQYKYSEEFEYKFSNSQIIQAMRSNHSTITTSDVAFLQPRGQIV